MTNHRKIDRTAKRIAGKLRGNLIEWSDLAQETKLRWLTGRKSIRGPMLDLLRCGVIGNSRKAPIQRRVDFNPQWPSGETPETLFARQELPTPLIRAIASLDDRSRRMLRLIYWDDLKSQDAAAVLGVSPGRVTQLRQQVLRKLKESIQ